MVGLIFATGCTWGTITDEQTGAAVRGATVTITDSGGQVVTVSANDAGVYIVSQQLAPGPATFEISAPGYATVTEQHTIAYDDNAQGHEIQHFKLHSDGSPPPPPASPFTLLMVPEAATAMVGVPSSVSFEAAGVTPNLRAFSIMADYDGSIIDVTAVTALNPLFDLCAALNPDTGGRVPGSTAPPYSLEATCGASSETGLPSGTVGLARVDFTCLRAGATTLMFTTAQAADETLTALEMQKPANATITCG
jgi:hypothetical protein